MAKLILMFNDQVLQEFPFLRESMTIGRNPENNIQIDNLAVSGHHAKIDKTGSRFILTDLQSTNSTFVNDKTIMTQLSWALTNCNSIRKRQNPYNPFSAFF